MSAKIAVNVAVAVIVLAVVWAAIYQAPWPRDNARVEHCQQAADSNPFALNDRIDPSGNTC